MPGCMRKHTGAYVGATLAVARIRIFTTAPVKTAPREDAVRPRIHRRRAGPAAPTIYRKEAVARRPGEVYNTPMETTEKKSISLPYIWRLCPVRHMLVLVSWLWLGFFFLFRGKKPWMNAICAAVVRPWHALAGRFYSAVRFSAAEWIIALWVVMGCCFTAQLVIHVVKKRPWEGGYRWTLSVLAMGSALFALFSLWWGVFYYSDSFVERSGLQRRPISAEELYKVTAYFAGVANEYSDKVQRDENGIFTADFDELFDRSVTLYRAAVKEVPCLDGPELRAKPVVFSKIMSLMNNTGFFFPYTAEANVNVDCTMALIPATVAHELAHQRGVAREDEANFCAVLACMADDDAAFRYSGALMAYVYLGNALHDTDYEAWLSVYESLNEDVHRDLSDHNAYWDRYDTPVADASDKVYEGFLKTYGDDRGMKSYDACVDLLTIWYLEAAQ